jgi:hypothetical protein
MLISGSANVSNTFAAGNAGQPLEEQLEIQALNIDLREAVMACLCGGESRRWTVLELVERFNNLGVCATRASVTAALAELALELELSSSRAVAPARTRNSEEHKVVLLVVLGHRRKGGVSKTRVGEILGLEASFYLDDHLRQGLIYCDPSRELNFWRPTQSALLALGLRSHTDIPADSLISTTHAKLKIRRAINCLEFQGGSRWLTPESSKDVLSAA